VQSLKNPFPALTTSTTTLFALANRGKGGFRQGDVLHNDSLLDVTKAIGIERQAEYPVVAQQSMLHWRCFFASNENSESQEVAACAVEAPVKGTSIIISFCCRR
jgi:hypothetical protein